MGSFSIWHWLIVLVIVMLIFGTKKLRNMGADLGGAVRGFKEGMREGGGDKPADPAQAPPTQPTRSSANGSASRRAQSGRGAASSSTNATISPEAAAAPALRACESPGSSRRR